MDPEHCAHCTGAPNEHGNGNKSREVPLDNRKVIGCSTVTSPTPDYLSLRLSNPHSFASKCEGKHKKAPLQVPRMSEVDLICSEEESPEEPFEPLTQEVSVPLTQASPLRTIKDVNRSEQNVGAGWQLSREPGDLVSTPQSEEKKMYMTEDEDEMDVMEQTVFPLTQEVSLPLTQKVSSLHRSDLSDWEDAEQILERALLVKKHVRRLKFDCDPTDTLKSRKKKRMTKIKLKKKDKFHPKRERNTAKEISQTKFRANNTSRKNQSS
ncbi:uncharacterized protein LOC144020996 [Festucalex cinctus]